MGQQQSTDKGEKSGRSGTPQGESQKKVNRRISVNKLAQRGPTPVDPSVSNASATAQTIPQQHIQNPALQRHLHSPSPELSSKQSSVERSSSRNSPRSARQNDLEHQHKQQTRSIPTTHSPSVPMDVPTASRSKPSDQTEGQHASYDRSYAPVSVLRPPRLPLPIAGAIPDSPTLQPVDKPQKDNTEDAIFEDDVPESAISIIEAGVRRQSSMLSNDTQDEDEVGDELQPYAAQVTSQLVPTLIAWNHPGDKVYVTGTFANWEKKFKLHKSKSTFGMSAVIQLPPGTHHLKFIVDGDMMINTDLPTAVDYTNVLVNYLEVNADEIPVSKTTRRESDRSKIPYPAHPPLAPPPETEEDSGADTEIEREPVEEEIPLGDFRQLIPQALIDMEQADEDPRYQAAATIIQDCPGPPSMPLFLGKSVLNGTLPLKDDSSVLPLPNHTVLNHLATSSLKNGVLATSVTTRYKKKYVTTIMYRPVRHSAE